MKLHNSSHSTGRIISLVLCCYACGGAEDKNVTGTMAISLSSAGGTSAQGVISPAPSNSTSTMADASVSATTNGGAADVGAATATSNSIDGMIAAAQTPDGRAIPQGANSDGSCPPVLVALGFWSCPVLLETCSYQANGAVHNCLCQRSDGEGQLPAWVCDQP